MAGFPEEARPPPASGVVVDDDCCEWRFRRGGGSTRLPQRTESRQCESGQPWPCHWALQGQMQPLL